MFVLVDSVNDMGMRTVELQVMVELVVQYMG
jgi:hypothetical protein